MGFRMLVNGDNKGSSDFFVFEIPRGKRHFNLVGQFKFGYFSRYFEKRQLMDVAG